MKLQVGDYIKIILMSGEPLYNGREGVVTNIDDAGNVHGTWGGCAVILDKDIIIKKYNKVKGVPEYVE